MGDGRRTMHLVIDGGERLLMRTVAPPSTLPTEGNQGTAAEDASRGAAAKWSLPDFAFKSVLAEKGNANREVGDTLIVCGKTGLVMQVKSRTRATARKTREINWVNSNVAKGCRQAAGSIRTLTRTTLLAVNERGREVKIDGPDIRWLSLVIVDHPDVPEIEVPASGPNERPRVVLSRRDWEFLFDQLRSTHAVIQYLWRVADEPDHLDRESERYYDLALKDEVTESAPLDSVIYGEGVQTSSGLVPLAPTEGAGADHELMFRAVMEGIASGDGMTPEQSLLLLSELDQVLVGYRTELGSALLRNLEAARGANPPRLLSRTVRQEHPAPQLIFATATYLSESIAAQFEDFVTVRHQDALARLKEPGDLATIGVMLTPLRDGEDGWETTAIRVHGTFDHSFIEELRASAEVPTSKHSPDRFDVPSAPRTARSIADL